MAHFWFKLIYCTALSLAVSIGVAGRTALAQAPVQAGAVLTPNYARVLMPLADPSSVRVHHAGDIITLDFTNVNAVDFSDITRNLGAFINAVSVDEQQNRITLNLMQTDYDVRHFIGENLFGVDILPKNPQSLKEASTSARKSLRVRLYEKPTPEQTETVGPPAAEPGSDSKEQASWAVSSESRDGATGATPTTPKKAPSKPGELTVTLEKTDTETVLHFPWDSSTAAAAFHQGNSFWLVFDQPTKLTLDALAGMPYFTHLHQQGHPAFTLLRGHLSEEYSFEGKTEAATPLKTSLTRSNLEWQLRLQPTTPAEMGNMNHLNQIRIVSQRSDTGPQIFASIARPGDILELDDQEMGGPLVVVPVYQEATATYPERRYVDVHLIKTLQGLAFRPLADNVTYRAEREGVAISSPRGLHLSSELLTDSEEERRLRLLEAVEVVKSQEVPATSILPFDAVLRGKIKNVPYQESRQALYQTLAAAPEEEKQSQHFEMARYFFNAALYADTLGIIRDFRNRYPLSGFTRDMDLMAAVSEYMLGHYRDAEALFSEEAIDLKDSANLSEILLWQWASRYQRSQLDKQSRKVPSPVDFISSYDKFMLTYPQEVRYGLGLLAAAEKIENKDVNAANTILEMISYDEIPPRFANDTEYYLAHVAMMQENYSKATDLWQRLANQLEDRQNRARAGFELVKMDLVTGKITPEDAAKELDKLLVVWRGDQLEVDILKLIGELYIQTKQYSEGLRAWQTLVTNFPDTKEALFIAGKMKQTFINLFDKGDAYQLPPYEALSLYFEFRELTPVGSLGDRIVQQLATHFINADLLDNAIAILTHQLKFRDVGDKRNQLAIRLANLQLLNRRPENVPDSLSYMDYENASVEELLQSRYIMARALVEQARHKEAFDLLVNNFTPDANDIRLEIFWRQGNWFGIMNILEPRLWEIRETAPLPLNNKEIMMVKRLAVAYSAQEENYKLQKLKEDFARRIEDKNVAEVFDFLTLEPKQVRPASLQDTVQLDALQNFVNDYAFWPAQQWDYAVEVLEPKVAAFTPETVSSNLEEEKDVVRLAVAYAMLLEQAATPADQAGERKKKGLEKQLRDLQQKFKDVRIDSTTLDVFKTFDPEIPDKVEEDVVFTGSLTLREVSDFIDIYRNAQTVTELNAATQ